MVMTMYPRHPIPDRRRGGGGGGAPYPGGGVKGPGNGVKVSYERGLGGGGADGLGGVVKGLGEEWGLDEAPELGREDPKLLEPALLELEDELIRCPPEAREELCPPELEKLLPPPDPAPARPIESVLSFFVWWVIICECQGMYSGTVRF